MQLLVCGILVSHTNKTHGVKVRICEITDTHMLPSNRNTKSNYKIHLPYKVKNKANRKLRNKGYKVYK